ncbi:hypothetical protein AB4Z51_20015 [Bradyrhizobium sp. 2TAF36]|uniref:hypothetical protein n=1 Tax=unclassified Bradyrhizobium TaxID=2631580 RepID=UPI00142F4FB4|nr:hypothetical protein [Bradyrhizobium sp. MOS001]
MAKSAYISDSLPPPLLLLKASAPVAEALHSLAVELCFAAVAVAVSSGPHNA